MTDGGGMAEMQPQARKMTVVQAEGVQTAHAEGRPYEIPSASTGRLELTIPNPSKDPNVLKFKPFLTVDFGLVTTNSSISGAWNGMSTDNRPDRPQDEPLHTARFDLGAESSQPGGKTSVEEERSLMLKKLGVDDDALVRHGVKSVGDVTRIDLVLGVDKTLFPPYSEVPQAHKDGIHIR